MKSITKSEPDFYMKFIKKKKPVNWDDIKEIRHKLRRYILEKEQNFQCAYCESAITEDSSKSHIDHFFRKHHFSELTFDYNNLMVSCKKTFHCASTKDSQIKKNEYHLLINPVIENPDDYFGYSISGNLISKNKRAKFTENIFNLNHASLKQQRKDISFAVIAYKDTLKLNEIITEIGAFESYIRAIW